MHFILLQFPFEILIRHIPEESRNDVQWRPDEKARILREYGADMSREKALYSTGEVDNEEMNKEKASLVANIDDVLNGTSERKKELENRFFFVADTPLFMKEKGLTGQYFSIRYGVITRHRLKDADHELTGENWKALCDAIKSPFAIAKYRNGYRLFTNVKANNNFICVGVDVKNIGNTLEINAIKTAFGYRGGNIDSVVYVSDEITPEQTALLRELNSPPYPPAPSGDTALSPTSSEMSSVLPPKEQNFSTFQEKDGGSDTYGYEGPDPGILYQLGKR